jgi:hypothetical protein
MEANEVKILFVNSRSPDYLEDMLFSGLTELIGVEAVAPAPVNHQYYLPRRVYPRNLGYCRSSVRLVQDLLALRRRIRQADFDAVVIGSTKRDTFEQFLRLAEALPPKLPVIYVDGGDWEDVGGDARRMGFESLFGQVMAGRPPLLVFKREYVIGREYGPDVIPLPMGYRPQAVPTTPKRYDVTCWCVESHEMRTRALSLLEDRYDCRDNGTVRGQKFKTYKRQGVAYLADLGASRIACNFRGVGWDTLRYWEIPGVRAFMISSRPQIVIPDDFRHGEHVAFCRDDLGDLTSIIDYYLRNEAEREQMAAAARDHLLARHTHLHRAERFLEAVQARLRS